jgi:YgiT-type zinc finger domain-containing protein
MGERGEILHRVREASRDFQEEGRAMKCVHCGGEMRRATTPLHIDRKGCHLTVDEVPAWVCGQCGEPFFEERELAAVQELARSVDEKCRALGAGTRAGR